MFDERTVHAYRSITAPPELKEKVLAQAKSEKTVPFNKKKTTRWVRQLSTAAACLVLMVGVWAASRESGSGAELSVNAVVMAAESENSLVRIAAEEPLSVKLEISCESELSCSEGELLVQGEDDLAPVNHGASCRATEKALVFWEIPAADPTETYELTLTGENTTLVITLMYDTAENCWTVSYAE